MRKSIFGIIISLTVPLFLFMNVFQAEQYMIDFFEIRGLISEQETLVFNNKKLINRVAELESPTRVASIMDSESTLKKIGGGEIIRLEVVSSHE